MREKERERLHGGECMFLFLGIYIFGDGVGDIGERLQRKMMYVYRLFIYLNDKIVINLIWA